MPGEVAESRRNAIEGMELTSRSGCKDIAAWSRMLVAHPWIDILPHGMEKDMVELACELEANGIPEDKSVQPLESTEAQPGTSGQQQGALDSPLFGPDPIPLEALMHGHGGDDSGFMALLVSETVSQGTEEVSLAIWESFLSRVGREIGPRGCDFFMAYLERMAMHRFTPTEKVHTLHPSPTRTSSHIPRVPNPNPKPSLWPGRTSSSNRRSFRSSNHSTAWLVESSRRFRKYPPPKKL